MEELKTIISENSGAVFAMKATAVMEIRGHGIERDLMETNKTIEASTHIAAKKG
ncbi:hypothetical protein [Schinkia azotoformans]|uniref:hypothetical protein n=1 Tax=Schinkia azotoformans TaxID=1454 RepID=UPI002DB80A7B|nr:hypothetical protein [Schinkia azotoformans]MEC1718130.1 hypothetical protein [Schinkia azotoformans]MEC1742108.1 hypothetical protein [Schinkia azotoformans]MEC1748042.1 hypothetical protein [Schinkia azotoformans]MEC1765004.1 hypothetical protein [Schinkia azotoformans]MEC1772469.1 hypothetical protein [Schinkia azotoformans]